MKSNNNMDSRPIPDPTLLTTKQLDREIAHLKELAERDRDSEREARKVALEGEQEARRVALESLDRRLLELPELRSAITKLRGEFVRTEVYGPAHEELRGQRQADSERSIQMQSDIKANSNAIARLESSVTWLARLIIAAVIAYAFQKLFGK